MMHFKAHLAPLTKQVPSIQGHFSRIFPLCRRVHSSLLANVGIPLSNFSLALSYMLHLCAPLATKIKYTYHNHKGPCKTLLCAERCKIPFILYLFLSRYSSLF